MHELRNQQILCAYALLLTVAGGMVAMDPFSPTDFRAAQVNPAARAEPLPALSVVLPSELPPVADTSVPARDVVQARPGVALPAVAKPKRLAAPGTVYVTTRVSVMAQSGVHALSPGTPVRLLLRKGNRLKVTDGHHDFEVTAAQVTTDIDLAESLARAMTLAGGPVRQ
ncbi:MAG TPA: hypothetical protein VGO90_05010 [Chthoniobacteraceae bacterium]|jgi:hypothetical protein|nr:hypothetical protein [Chthoniobacteraceae bacterium]